MTNEELRKYVNQIIDYLKSDFTDYEKAREKGVKIGAGPYLLTASSGIDFLGSLAVPEAELNEKEKKAKGLELKSTKGSKWYIRTYLGKVDQKYMATKVGDLIYKYLRCGQVHEGMVKKGVMIGTEMPRSLHLEILKLKESDVADASLIRVTYVNTRVLATDFIDSIQYFVNDMNNIESFAMHMAIRLEEHLNTTGDVCQGLGLSEQEVDPHTFFEIYDVSSSSPDKPEGSYRLIDSFWNKT